MNEQAIQQQIRLELGQGPVRLWRNNTGALRDERGRLVRYGLCPGSSDLIGLRQLRIKEQHLGLELGVFCALEIKAASGRLSREQRQFLEVISSRGGLAGVARSVEEARAILRLS
jgi:hypothetical protein